MNNASLILTIIENKYCNLKILFDIQLQKKISHFLEKQKYDYILIVQFSKDKSLIPMKLPTFKTPSFDIPANANPIFKTNSKLNKGVKNDISSKFIGK